MNIFSLSTLAKLFSVVTQYENMMMGHIFVFVGIKDWGI